ncbi:MAG TPA: bifunctional nuclease family protein [Bacteroidota bacterium]|nr:bifunctional nuclease family protein [Candidatus Kapabacteria bacterium]HRS01803.1 bifunctional nuclease family protein [Bacteroidota bacterium]HRT68553.1 bifunctional nuclease family protein [Bacteroidota bacterium]
MNTVEVRILGISSTPGGNAFGLILKEVNGSRRLPIIIGAFEAQSIAFEIENIDPPRPMTHDLIKNILITFGYKLNSIIIDSLDEGTFHAKLNFDEEGVQIDCRPSDAIAIALRMNAPIYVNEDILDEAGVSPQIGESEEYQNEDDDEPEDYGNFPKSEPEPEHYSTGNKKLDILQSRLDRAIEEENYELAAKLRDEIQNLLRNS